MWSAMWTSRALPSEHVAFYTVVVCLMKLLHCAVGSRLILVSSLESEAGLQLHASQCLLGPHILLCDFVMTCLCTPGTCGCTIPRPTKDLLQLACNPASTGAPSQ